MPRLQVAAKANMQVYMRPQDVVSLPTCSAKNYSSGLQVQAGESPSVAV
jgi:hypothetical protein